MNMDFGDVFAVIDGGSNFLCEPGAKEAGVELDSEDVPTWEVGSNGWLGPIMCKNCKRSIPVICDGTESQRRGIELRVWVDDKTIPAGRDEQVMTLLRDHTLTYEKSVVILTKMEMNAKDAFNKGVYGNFPYGSEIKGTIWPCQCARCQRPYTHKEGTRT